MTARHQLFQGYKQLADSQHDPVDRQLPDEPRLCLLARDFRSPSFSRMYAYAREGKFDRAREILNALERLTKQQPPAPHKDTEHAQSARHVADLMDLWRLENMRGEDVGGRIDTANYRAPETFEVVPTHAEIKAARPPVEPGEAQ